MTDEEILLAAIVADPTNMPLRLVYADAVQEAGDELRAEFIRLSVEWEEVRLTTEKCGPDRKRRNAVHKRLSQVFRSLHRGDGVGIVPADLSARSQGEQRFSHASGDIEYYWRNGFVETASYPFWMWVGSCRICKGTGRLRYAWCPDCRGRPDNRGHPVGPSVVVAHPLMTSLRTGQRADRNRWYGAHAFRLHLENPGSPHQNLGCMPDGIGRTILDTPIDPNLGGWADNMSYVWFHLEQDADRYLSEVLLKWAKSENEKAGTTLSKRCRPGDEWANPIVADD